MEYKNSHHLLHTYMEKHLNDKLLALKDNSQAEGVSFAYLDHGTLELILLFMLTYLQTSQQDRKEEQSMSNADDVQKMIHTLEEVMDETHSGFQTIIQLLEEE
ncbi:hypothetical protein CAI16_18690 [Virgibacillus dokdonensis]|uniref:Uncharacterized protein n=1 Tax=Virgibacillus dokdonensis TaxID=302167 RepID=A0A3E0WJX7_9BACI|nr:hypothetical protein [Virgibacillus dokdonensis]RFA32225.1 hypothetical protein CAI16_18690 [Virgibacillus dokdonensis]